LAGDVELGGVGAGASTVGHADEVGLAVFVGEVFVLEKLSINALS
jgi:hypothetical protein